MKNISLSILFAIIFTNISYSKEIYNQKTDLYPPIVSYFETYHKDWPGKPPVDCQYLLYNNILLDCGNDFNISTHKLYDQNQLIITNSDIEVILHTDEIKSNSDILVFNSIDVNKYDGIVNRTPKPKLISTYSVSGDGYCYITNPDDEHDITYICGLYKYNKDAFFLKLVPVSDLKD